MKLCPKCQKQFSDDANFCPVDAARLVPLEAPAAGADALSARFELGTRIGGNRTGAVHRATDKTTGKPVIVKLVAPAVVALPGVAQRLERELRQLERVQSAGVAKVIASGKRGDESWLAMELLEGATTLADAIGMRGPIPANQAADLIEVIGEALIEAAQVGVVHRDLAPKNVLFAGQDVKLVNFSLAVPTTDKVPGVAEFIAPEQVDGRPVDQRSNLYSLGALYYFVLTGHTVFSGGAIEVHDQHKSGTIRPPSQLAPNAIAAGSPIENVIMRALDRSPTKRFLTVRQFVDEVGRVGRGEVIELKQAQPTGKRPKGELVQTLMGVAKSGDAAPKVASPIASAPTVGSGLPSVPSQPAQPVIPAAMPQPRAPQPALMAQTVVGVATGAPAQPAAAAAPAPAPPQMMAAQPVPAGVQPSPWAPPPAQAQALPQTQVMPPPMQAPAPQAPVMPSAPVMPQPQAPQAPVVGAPVVAGAAAGKKKADEGGGTKGKFRETMWFKKGDLDTQAAIAAADERARTGKDAAATDKVDSMPIDERYKDDGSITRGDKEKYSLRTGATQMMQALRPDGAGTSMKVSEDALIGEMKGGRGKIIGAVIAGVVLIILIIVFATR